MLPHQPNAGSAPVYLERPLCELQRDAASTLLNQLYGSNQRFARAFYRYWRQTVHQSEEEAWRSTFTELAQSASALLRNLTDPRVHTIGLESGRGYQPIGMFAFRPLHEHVQGRILRDTIRSGHLATRYRGRSAIAHAVALLDEHATRSAFESVLLSIARKALEGAFSFVFFYTSDERLASLYRRYGMEFPPDLGFPHSAHLVGVYQPARPDNLQRMTSTAHRLGVDLAVSALA